MYAFSPQTSGPQVLRSSAPQVHRSTGPQHRPTSYSYFIYMYAFSPQTSGPQVQRYTVQANKLFLLNIHVYLQSTDLKSSGPQVHRSTDPQVHGSKSPKVHKSTSPQVHSPRFFLASSKMAAFRKANITVHRIYMAHGTFVFVFVFVVFAFV